MKTFVTSLENFHSNLWQFHCPVPTTIAENFIEGNNKRVLCHIKDQTIHVALMKSKEYWFILINKELKEKLLLTEGMRIEISLEKDHSEFGHDMPEELQALLDQDEEGNQYFRKLSMGKQRSLVYIVTKVKNSQSRLNKALAIVHHLKDARGELDFKRLNEWIKYYNNLQNP